MFEYILSLFGKGKPAKAETAEPAMSSSGKGHDIVSFVLGNQSYDQNKAIYLDPSHPGRWVTASDARMIIKKLIAGLQAAGLHKGDVVCVYTYNDIRYPLLFLAIVGAGGIFTGCNPSYTATEVTRHVTQTKSKILIVESNLIRKVKTNIADYKIPTSRIFQIASSKHSPEPHYPTYEDLLAHGESDWVVLGSVEQARSTTAALLSTSGTSGLPKAAMHSHHHFIAQAKMIDDNEQKPYEVSRLVALPVFHAFALPLAHTLPLLQGTPTYIMRRFELSQFLDHIHEYNITETAIVPTIVMMILKGPTKASKKLSQLRTVWCAGSKLPQLAQNDFFRLLKPTARLLQTWGMTEAGWMTTFLWPEKDHSGSVGRLLGDFEAKLLDKGEEIRDDLTEGEIYVRSADLMQGYLDNEEATNAAIDRDGWLRTGDIAYREHGMYYVVDRAKELIKVRGWQISPAELETQLLSIPGTVEAAVVGVDTHESDSELPRAYVVKEPGSGLTERDIKEDMAEHLAPYKSLDGGVRFVDAIPRNGTGKVMRAELKKLAAIERATQQQLDTTVVQGDSEASRPASSLSPTPDSEHSPKTDSTFSSEASSDIGSSGKDDGEHTATPKPNAIIGIKDVLKAQVDHVVETIEELDIRS